MQYDAPDTQRLMAYFSTRLGNVFETYSELLSSEAGPTAMPSGTCVPFSRKLFVKVDGKIMPCERIPHSFYFGTVKDGKVTLDYQSVADKFNSYLDRLGPRCSKCASMDHCSRCLYTIEGIETDRFVCDSFTAHSHLKQIEAYCKAYLFKHPTLYKNFIEDVIIN